MLRELSIGIAVVAGVVGMAATVPTEAALKRFRFESINDRSLKLWEGDKPVFVYNHGLISGKGAPPRSTYLHPIYGLDGEVLTDDFPADHPYHRGFYWAWPHVKISESEYALWTNQGIRQDYVRWIKQESNPWGATLSVENAWVAGDRKVAREEVEFRVHPERGDSRAIDVTFKWTPLDRDITLRGAEGKAYGGPTMRYAPRTHTVITEPEGRTTEDLMDTRLAWADLSADFQRPGRMSGIALFPETPQAWMTRHYGLLALGWPGVNDRTLAAGKTYTLKCGLWVHRGNPAASEIASGPYSQYICRLNRP